MSESVFAAPAERSFAGRGTHLLSSNLPPNAPRRPKGSLVKTCGNGSPSDASSRAIAKHTPSDRCLSIFQDSQ